VPPTSNSHVPVPKTTLNFGPPSYVPSFDAQAELSSQSVQPYQGRMVSSYIPPISTTVTTISSRNLDGVPISQRQGPTYVAPPISMPYPTPSARSAQSNYARISNDSATSWHYH
jgi:hypothetical protein